MWKDGTVEYNGTAPLTADTQYQWHVRWWTSAGSTSSTSGPLEAGPSKYSAVALFTVGLLKAADWHNAVSIHTQSSPAPPSPTPASPVATCKAACDMKAVKGGYYAGVFSETGARSVNSTAGCIAACLADETCVAATWAPEHADKCVKYSKIYNSLNGGALGWVKCDAGASSSSSSSHGAASACPPFSPSPPAPPSPGSAQMMRRSFEAPSNVAAASKPHVITVLPFFKMAPQRVV